MGFCCDKMVILKLEKQFKFLFLIPIILIFLSGFKYTGSIVDEIEIKGVYHTSKGDVEDAIIQEEDEPLSEKKIAESIKNIYSLGKYDDVKVEVEKVKKNKVKVIFVVKEKYIITDVEFKGNDELSDKELQDTIKEVIDLESKEEKPVLDEAKLVQAKELIKEKYEEEGMEDVDITVIKVKDEKERECKLIFKIVETDKIRVKRIRIFGCKAFSEDTIIGKMETHEDDWLHSGIFHKDEFEKDKERIIDFYRKNGFIYARITNIKIRVKLEGKKFEKEKSMYIDIYLTEGEQYKFGGYTIKGNYLFTEEEILDKLKLKRGEIFNQIQFEKDMQTIYQMYGTRGYIFAKIEPQRKVDKKNKWISYTINITENDIAHIEDIIVRGNVKTKTYVITREIILRKGEIFNFWKYQRSQERVYNLGFFQDVKFNMQPGSAKGLMDIIVNVKEQQTGMVTLGLTYGTVGGLGGYQELSENNLKGRGIRIHERTEFQQKKQNYELGMRYPWIFGTPTYLSFSLFYRLNKEIPTGGAEPNTSITYNKQEWGGSLGISRRVTEYIILSFLYNLEVYQYFGATGVPENEELRELIGKGDNIKSSFSFKFNYDSRDNIFNPTKGINIWYSIQLTGGFLGGRDRYIKHIWNISKFYPILDFFVFAAHFNFGVITPNIDGKSPVISAEDLFHLGGVETVRGWKYTDPQWINGGRARFYSNIELRFPIVKNYLWSVLFLDGGDMWSSTKTIVMDYRKLYYSTGFGFKLQIPMLPIRLYFSKRFLYDEGTRKWVWLDKTLGDWQIDFGVGELF